ncbi:MAG: hypothetical protein KC486_02985 [Myxococcales bacterium]|nr:hypothetical protein [Myxococcales bacterium]
MRARPLAVFALTFAVLAAIAGERLLRPSANNHYSHLAAAWLDGRLSLEGRPPGYPKRHDDWGVVTTLVLRDDAVLERAYRCRTTACEERRRSEHVEMWWTADGALHALGRRDIKARHETWYVTFPPGPALLFLPGVALFGLSFLDVLLTALLAALIPAVLVAFLDRIRGTADGRGRENLWAAAAWAFASPALFVGAHGSVWFTAQIAGALFLTLHLAAAWDARRPALAGLCLGMAVACRPTTAFALPFFAAEWWREGRRWRSALAFAAPLALIGGALMLHNYLRFADVFEFGHRYLDIRWQRRMQELGMFSAAYLRRNLECMLWLAPQVSAAAPYLRWSIHGMGLLLASPWLLLLAAARRRFPQRAGLIIAAVAVAIPPLLYHNSGQLQLTYRFALDYLPLLVLLLAVGGGLRHRRLAAALILLSAALQLYGAWNFQRAPGEIFVHDRWWPFAPE